MSRGSKNSVQEFNINKINIITMKLFLVAAFLLLAIMLVASFLENEGIFTAITGIVFCVPAILLFRRELKKFSNSNIVIDDDGIWYKHLGKAQGLILWDRISYIKKKSTSLELLDSSSIKLLSVNYGLIDFKILQSILSDKICIDEAV